MNSVVRTLGFVNPEPESVERAGWLRSARVERLKNSGEAANINRTNPDPQHGDLPRRPTEVTPTMLRKLLDWLVSVTVERQRLPGQSCESCCHFIDYRDPEDDPEEVNGYCAALVGHARL
jgi:hypothetical protein